MKIRCKYFSMVELVLAIAVAVLGVFAVLALLPVGMNASRDAVADNYLPDMAEQMLTFIQMQNDCDIDFAENVLPAARPSSSGDADGYFYPDEGTWGASIFGGSRNEAGGLVLETSVAGEYLVVQQVVIDGIEVPEFAGVMKVWRAPSLLDEDIVAPAVGGADPADNYKYHNVIVEISWPAELPYQRRVELGNTRIYSMELFNHDSGVVLP
jgi:hypothetical protein